MPNTPSIYLEIDEQTTVIFTTRAGYRDCQEELQFSLTFCTGQGESGLDGGLLVLSGRLQDLERLLAAVWPLRCARGAETPQQNPSDVLCGMAQP